MEQKRIYGLISGGIVIIMLIYNIVANFMLDGFSLNIFFLLSWIPSLLYGVGMISGVYIIFAVGCGVNVVANLINMIKFFGSSSYLLDVYPAYYGGLLIQYFLLSVAAIVMAIAVFNRRNAKILGIVGGALGAAASLIPFFGALISGLNIDGFGLVVLFAICHFVWRLLAGMAMADEGSEAVKSAAVSARRPVETVGVSAQLEKLQQLKQLLDMGIITQEEFEQKKAEILR